jgi:hypothetical protein
MQAVSRLALEAALLLTLLVLLPSEAQPINFTAQPTPATSGTSDRELLLAFKRSFANGDSVLSSWGGDQPCAAFDADGGSSWQGILCDSTAGGTSRVVAM